jgi:hypothetical protein
MGISPREMTIAGPGTRLEIKGLFTTGDGAEKSGRVLKNQARITPLFKK